MNMRSRVTGWTVLTLAVLTPWQGLNFLGKARAQAPLPPGAVASGPEQKPEAKKIYTSKTVFHLPIKMDVRARANLQEVNLWVKSGAGGWQKADTKPPSQEFFTYQVTQDGEYWFSVVTVDKAGRATPPDVSREAPGLMVVVDTQPPDVEVHRTTEAGEVCVRCSAKHTHPDLPAPRLSFRAADGTWRELDPLPGVKGVFRIPPGQDVLSSTVRVNAFDVGRNAWSREIQLSESGPAAAAPQGTAAAPGPQQAGGDPLSLPEPATPVQPPPPPKNLAAGVTSVPPTGVSGGASETVVARPSFDGGITPVSHTVAAAAAGGSNHQILNTTHATIEYRLDHVGPSGVSKVEIWLTSDQGRSWQRVCDDVDLRTPAEVDLPGEGVYGLRLVVTNGNGFGGSGPVRGDAPHYWVEVDTTAPHAQLKEIDPITSGGNLEIRWTASDKNLAAEPVSLFYATRREGPWSPIVRNLKNDGAYRWAFPRDGGSQFFVRLEVTDQAGNVTRCEPPAPVVLDMTEPHALVVGVTGGPARPAPAPGN